MSKGDDIEERLIEFGVRVIRLCGRLPDTFVAQHIGKQLVRSGTAPEPPIMPKHEAQKVTAISSTSSKSLSKS